MLQQHFPFVALFIFGLAPLVAHVTAAERLPNIVYILADDLGYAELGCYGQEKIKTPHLDRLAAEGIRFTQHYSGNAVCATARCVLMTGKHTGHAYVRNNGNPKGMDDLRAKYGWEYPGQYPLPADEITIAEVLKQKGYATAAAGKWGLGSVGTTGGANQQGFDLFYGFYCQVHAHNHYPRFLWRNDQKETLPGNNRTLYGKTYSQDRFVDVGLAFIRENKDRPFFLYLPFAVPHLSIQAPEAAVAEYKGVLPETTYKHKGYLQHPFPHAGYAAMITHMDRGVGQIMSLLQELGLEEQTLVIFASDNGPTYDRLGGSDSEFFDSAGGLRGFKGSLYEGGIRIPMIARWPGKTPAGAVSDHISAFWDVLPTLADAAGAEAPLDIDGVSFLPTLLGRNGQQQKHEYLYWEFPAYGWQQAVRLGNWKGIRPKIRRKNPQLKIELYDLKSDRGEKHDVASLHPQIVARIASIMKTGRTPSKRFPFPALDRQ